MGRSKLNVTSTSSSGTNFSRREEKAADSFIAGNTVLAKAVEEKPELRSVIATALVTNLETTPQFRIPPELVLERPPTFTLPNFPTTPPIFTLPPGVTLPPVTPVPSQPVSQIDLEIQLLLNAIPIANEGNIITSEYHNSLRKALLAIAERMGLTIKPVSELQIFTFAPNFLPVWSDEAPVPSWVMTFDKAVLPAIAAGAAANVKGNLAVQLPDDATIVSMTVRGARVTADKEKPKPKLFNVKLNRQKFDTETAQVTPLITFKLADEKEKIKEVNDIKGSLPDDLDDATARSRVLDLSRVNNQTYQYFIEANWDGDNNAAKFEIYSLQILCQI